MPLRDGLSRLFWLVASGAGACFAQLRGAKASERPWRLYGAGGGVAGGGALAGAGARAAAALQGRGGGEEAEGPQPPAAAGEDQRGAAGGAPEAEPEARGVLVGGGGARRHQEKVRGFREARQRLGRGCSASLGDADAIALGLGAEVATPRRGCILDSLSLEELALVRSNPRWYLEAFLESDFEASRRARKAFKRLSVEDEEFSGNREVLIDFFTPARKEDPTT